MINSVIVIGCIHSEPEIVVTKDKVPTKWVKFILAVQRPFKNQEDEYDSDFVTIKTWLSNIEDIKEGLRKDKIVGVKARVQSFNGGGNNTIHHIELIAEKIIPYKWNKEINY